MPLFSNIPDTWIPNPAIPIRCFLDFVNRKLPVEAENPFQGPITVFFSTDAPNATEHDCRSVQLNETPAWLTVNAIYALAKNHQENDFQSIVIPGTKTPQTRYPLWLAAYWFHVMTIHKGPYQLWSSAEAWVGQIAKEDGMSDVVSRMFNSWSTIPWNGKARIMNSISEPIDMLATYLSAQ